MEMELSGGNIFEDLELENAATLRVKARLAGKIVDVLRNTGESVAAASQRSGLVEHEIPNIYAGKLDGLRVEDLVEALACLDWDVDLHFSPR